MVTLRRRSTTVSRRAAAVSRRSTTVSRRAAAVLAGLVADAVFGEPSRAHPVAAFGSGMAALERVVWADRRGRGAAYAGAGVTGAAGAGMLAARVVGPTAALAAATAVCAAGRALADAALSVGAALDRGDLEGARRLLPALVGRSPDGMDEKEVARAVVESVAENFSDAVVATVVWGLVGGAPGALAHRAANTLDAMVGHRTPRHERFGWAAARVDDGLGWPAARVSAALVALAAPRRARAVWTTVRRDAGVHPSPNAGVAEAAFAAALGVRLGGPNRYGDRVELRPPLGDGRTPQPADIAAAVGLSRRATVVLGGLLAAVAAAPLGRRSRPARQRGAR